MVGIFRQKNPGNNLLLLAYGLVLKFGILLKPSPPLRMEEDHYLYRLLLRFLDQFALPDIFYGITAFLLLFIQATMLNKACINQKLLSRPNYLPGMAFMLLSSLFIEWNHFSAPLLVNTLLIIMFSKVAGLYNTSRPLAAIFNIGLLMGFSTLIYQPALIHLAMLPFILFIMRPFRIREWLTGMLGITAPYYFLALEPLFTNRWTWKHLIPSISLDLPVMPTNLLDTISILLLVIPFIVGGLYVQNNLNKILIQIRKVWSVLLLYLIVSLFIMLVDSGQNYVSWMPALMPLAAFHAAAYFYPVKRMPVLIIHWITFLYAIYLAYWL